MALAWIVTVEVEVELPDPDWDEICLVEVHPAIVKKIIPDKKKK